MHTAECRLISFYITSSSAKRHGMQLGASNLLEVICTRCPVCSQTRARSMKFARNFVTYTCRAGQIGAFCEHWIHHTCGGNIPNVPVGTAEVRYQLRLLVLGAQCQEEIFVTDFHDVQPEQPISASMCEEQGTLKETEKPLPQFGLPTDVTPELDVPSTGNNH
ncbi:hypothetical protein MTO96_006651 [Rhipicephalus appendiculatus]